jgi:type I restriction enzyme M protein
MPAATITLSQLESHLWEAANILRGPVDAADFKSYVFPLLFFKRISDVHDDEHAAEYRANGLPCALSAWLESSAAVRQSLQTLLSR